MNDREYYDRLASAYLRGRAERMSQEGPEIRAEGEKQEEKLYYFKRSPEKLPRVRMALGFLRSVWPESLLDVGSGLRLAGKPAGCGERAGRLSLPVSGGVPRD